MEVFAHAGHLDLGLNVGTVAYVGQVALCIGFTAWCLRIRWRDRARRGLARR